MLLFGPQAERKEGVAPALLPYLPAYRIVSLVRHLVSFQCELETRDRKTARKTVRKTDFKTVLVRREGISARSGSSA